MSKTYKITLEYEGAKYSGWQDQNNARTVMGELRQAAQDLFHGPVDIQGAGRTDAGVHALAQVAHFRTSSKQRLHPEQILRGLNDRLPAEIVILQVEEVPSRFHARHDAVSRSYVYQISRRKNAFAKKHVWWIKEPLDIDSMREAAALLAGRHDFVCFRAVDPSKPLESTIVVVDKAEVEEHGDLILFRIEASHFLWRMVRRIVGILVKLGKKEITIEQFRQLLDGKCGQGMKVSEWTAPAAGLFLERVRYKQDVE
ncbi:MAG: tRNA pseudouridine(38-40) synthase TruA [Acidobacteria bacterium]|nr:tRNA pseudouridine(38-40) synthase TruA [Acidobacteriota bacterium]